MSKIEVLEIFYSANRILTPDSVGRRIRRCRSRSSVYSYLLRLSNQGLLERASIGSRLAYRLTRRGLDRLFYLKQKEEGN
jgi:hypothetical protein